MSDEKVVVNYGGNSRKNQPKDPILDSAEKKLEPMDGVTVVARKKPLASKIAETFTGDDVGSVGDYVIFEVMLPAFKNLLFDVVSEGSRRMLFGSTGGGRSFASAARGGHTPYNRVAAKGSGVIANGAPRTISRTARATHDFRELVFDSRGEAEVALERLRDALAEYQNVTIADMYESAGITADIQDHNWGWIGNDLNQARVKPVSAGYLLDMPIPRELK